MDEEYLGDGLYASFDGWQITLRAPRDSGDHYVALEPAVYAALLRYVERLRASEPQADLTRTDEPQAANREAEHG